MRLDCERLFTLGGEICGVQVLVCTVSSYVQHFTLSLPVDSISNIMEEWVVAGNRNTIIYRMELEGCRHCDVVMQFFERHYAWVGSP